MVEDARKRARQACINCNARRIKCNVTEQQPCQNCAAASVSCDTRESRRGKHPRPSKKRRAESHATDEVTASHILTSLHKNRPAEGLNDDHFDTFGSSIEQQLSPSQDSKHEDDGDVFLGESTALRYVGDSIKDLSLPGGIPASKGVRLRHAVPNAVKAETLTPQWEVERRRARINFLTQDGAFSFPSVPIVEELLKAYFTWFHPCFAIIDEVDTWNRYRQGTLSPLLLQAMLFVGVLHCDDNTLNDLGFGTRHRAKYLFYNRARDIYDVEYERKTFTVIQALFLLSFWRAGALLEKDTRHWLGCAITLAQTKGLHRSAGKADTPEKKLRRRVWCSLYARDRQCSAALGLPNRIRDQDGDSESLETSDFDHAFHPSVSRDKAEEYAAYSIAMTNLASILGSVVHSGYLPHRSLNSSHRAQMRDELTKWKLRLPPAMQPDNEFGHPPSFHGNMVHLAYNNLLILLYRQGFIGSENDQAEIDGNIALQAAARSCKIIEDMLSDGNLRHGQIHVITNLFNTLCIHAVHLRRSEGTTKTVAEHRAKICLLGLQELQKTWEVTNWVLQLFFEYLDRATAVRLRVQGDEFAASAGGANSTVPFQTPLQQALEELVPLSQPPNRLPDTDTLPSAAEMAMPGATSWSWSSEEQNQYLFNQIENEFAFGEGEMLDWSPGEAATFSNPLFQPHLDPNFMP